VSDILLVISIEYSQCLTSYWSLLQYILSVWYPIGHIYSIFSVSDFLLLKSAVYSQCLISSWSHLQYILSVWHPIGHFYSISSVSTILLVISSEYSQTAGLLGVCRSPNWKTSASTASYFSFHTFLENLGSICEYFWAQHTQAAGLVSNLKVVLQWDTRGHPIGHIYRIFSVSDILLVTSTEYSQSITEHFDNRWLLVTVKYRTHILNILYVLYTYSNLYYSIRIAIS